MSKERRRELTAAYKERKARPGVFAVRCEVASLVWVGPVRELFNRQPGIWFALRMGQHRNTAMQAAWTAHGEDSFTYEELEVIDGEGMSGWAVDQAVKAAAAGWREALGAASA